jgi:CheY-like chemotaxis protein
MSLQECHSQPVPDGDVCRRRILVVDDEESLTKLVAMILEFMTNYVVRVENSATQAVATAEEFHPDLVLMDISMPAMDGGELASRFKTNAALHSIPIVFLTGTVTEQEVAEHEGYIGGLRFLAKPFEAADLLDCIAQQLAA